MIVDLGNSLGHVGDELKHFVNDELMRIEMEKENDAKRAFELEKLKLQNAKETEAERAKAETERVKAEAEQKKLQHEREAEEKRLVREAVQKRLEIEAEMADRERRTKLELEDRPVKIRKNRENLS